MDPGFFIRFWRGRCVQGTADDKDRAIRAYFVPCRTIGSHGDYGGDIEVLKAKALAFWCAVRGAEHGAAALAMTGEAYFRRVNEPRIGSTLHILLDQLGYALQDVTLSGRPLIGGDNDELTFDCPIDQASRSHPLPHQH